MKVIRLDAVEGNLKSAVFDESEDNEFEDLFNRWDDVEYLKSFFENHITDLQSGFYGSITVEDAIHITTEEANVFENTLIDYCDNHGTHSLLKLFKPLGTKDAITFRLQQNKARGSRPGSWLRVYAVRLDDIFIFSGGAIKLTRTMNERQHLLDELEKLKILVNYLKQHGINTDEDFYFLDNEEQL